jgi:hypothetical protein
MAPASHTRSVAFGAWTSMALRGVGWPPMSVVSCAAWMYQLTRRAVASRGLGHAQVAL